MLRAMRRTPLLVIASLALAACDDPPKGGAASAAASSKAAPSTTTASPPKPKTMPELTVDADGPYLGGTRIDLAANGGPEKLANVVKELPIGSSPVTLLVEKKAKVPAVAAVVFELGKAGAPTVVIRTDGRDDLPKEIVVTPEPRVSSAPPGCSVAAMVLKDLSTAIWPAKGGTGKRQRKGLAGPDLSHTGETLEKELEVCESSVAFFSAEEVPWENAFNIAGTVVTNDKKKRIATLILLKDTPVAGRPVTLAK